MRWLLGERSFSDGQREMSELHIVPHKIWMFVRAEGEMSPSEELHFLTCPHCQSVFEACLHSETFGAVLKMFEEKKSA
jgi:hypothetical protein